MEYLELFQLTLIFNTFLGDDLQSTLYSPGYAISDEGVEETSSVRCRDSGSRSGILNRPAVVGLTSFLGWFNSARHRNKKTRGMKKRKSKNKKTRSGLSQIRHRSTRIRLSEITEIQRPALQNSPNYFLKTGIKFQKCPTGLPP